jgi:hypothetical protein
VTGFYPDIPASIVPTPLEVSLANNAQLDAFGRLRVSTPTTLFDAQQEYGLDTRSTWDIAANGNYGAYASNGSVTSGASVVGPRNLNTRLVPITAGGIVGNSAIMQSRPYIRYIPGKSQFIAITGVYASSADDQASFVLRSSTSGAPVEREVAQADWSTDVFDGSGPSGITLDFTKTQILLIDAQWLAVGRVRLGFNVDGIFWQAHEYLNANNLPVPYTQTFNLPLRLEAVTTAGGTNLCAGYFDSANGVFLKLSSATLGAGLHFICCTVQSEGGTETKGLPWGISSGENDITVSTRRPVLSIRPKAAYNGLTNRAKVELIDYAVLCGANNTLIEVVIGGTLTGANFVSVAADSVVEYDRSATAIAGGYTIRVGYGQPGTNSKGVLYQGPVDIRSPLVLSQIDALAARQIPLTIVATSLGGNTDTLAAINWNEETL